MPSLVFTHNATLTYRPTADAPAQDVSAQAHQYLFEAVEVADGVTLEDIFGLLEKCPPLISIFQRDYAAEYAAEAAKGVLLRKGPVPEPEQLEFLELYQYWPLDSRTTQLGCVGHWQLHGVSKVLTSDYPDYAAVKGSRVELSLMGCPVRSLLRYPVRIRSKVTVYEAGHDDAEYAKIRHTFKIDQIQLHQLLHGILWELSFNGTPEESVALTDTLIQLKNSVEVQQLLADPGSKG